MAGDFLTMSNSGLIITVCCIILLVWELLAFIFGKRRALLSTWFQKLGFRAPAAVFALGALAGHFWMYFPPTIDDEVVQCPQCKARLTLNIDTQTGDLTATTTRE